MWPFKPAPTKCPQRFRSWFHRLIRRYDAHDEMLLNCISVWGTETWRIDFKCAACGALVAEFGVTDGQLMRFGFDIRKLKRATAGFMPWYPPPPEADLPDEITIHKGQTPGPSCVTGAHRQLLKQLRILKR